MAYFSYQGKSIFYQEHGQGSPLLFLHGNTASSKLFEPLLPLYVGQFRCVLVDFLGNGRSDRVDHFSPDMWHDEALQASALAEHLQLGAVSLLGTSGGAWAAVNAALERPDLFRAVVADSFDGRTLHDGFARQLLRERDAAKADEQARAFYAWCQGADWQTVVDLDTVALVQCAAEKRPLFCRPLSDLELPVLFIGSREDEMCRQDLEREYGDMAALVPDASVLMFPRGGHPALASNAEEAAAAICRFIAEKTGARSGSV